MVINMQNGWHKVVVQVVDHGGAGGGQVPAHSLPLVQPVYSTQFSITIDVINCVMSRSKKIPEEGRTGGVG